MTTLNTTTPAIFVTDYASYNAGLQFACGKWYQLNEYNSSDELIEAIENHYNEVISNNEEIEHKFDLYGININDLELMITDFEGFPRELYSESFYEENINEIIEFIQLNEEEQNKIEAFINCFGGDLKQAINKYESAFYGEFDNDIDFAYDYAEQTGVEISNTWPGNCIDWERAARELMFDFSEDNGYYFHSNW